LISTNAKARIATKVSIIIFLLFILGILAYKH
jgi:hypothetical protein